tara:strand:- start:825 stop:1448 length:624 start_codon:yes stop_codon:yes gene_type:complete
MTNTLVKYNLNDEEQKKVNKAIKFAKQFNNFKYSLCGKEPPKNTTKDINPFWFVNEKPPDLDFVKKKGLNCVGLANIVRRFMGLQVPGKVTGQKTSTITKKWPGSTDAWFEYLKDKKRLEKIDFKKVYPKGTLLIQDYNPKDQGHVSFTINSSKKGLLETKIIHCICDKDKETGKVYNNVTIEKVKDYYKYKRHTHICLPQNWLLKN